MVNTGGAIINFYYGLIFYLDTRFRNRKLFVTKKLV